MVNESIGIEGSRESHLTMALGTHLAERGAPPWFIQKQTGVGFRGMDAEVEDFYLWNYVHQELTTQTTIHQMLSSTRLVASSINPLVPLVMALATSVR